MFRIDINLEKTEIIGGNKYGKSHDIVDIISHIGKLKYEKRTNDEEILNIEIK